MTEIKKSLSHLRDRKLIEQLLQKIHEHAKHPLRIMEVCGTHTTAIFQHGLCSLLPKNIELLSGPGCPVCVTAAGHIDSFISLAKLPDIHLTTFGDLYRVPGSPIPTIPSSKATDTINSPKINSLAQATAYGAKISMVYSPMEALTLAQANPDELVVFLGIGFETTTPTVAATILAAHKLRINNFTVYSVHKLMPPALTTLFQEDIGIDGLLCPGHVSAIIGAKAYEPLAAQFKMPCVVGGFEAADILQALLMIIKQHNNGQALVENAYTRVVSQEGNIRARAVIDQVFMPTPTLWRGLGEIPASGLKIRPEYQQFDTEKRLNLAPVKAAEPPGCLCGQILKGLKSPKDCPLFGQRCTPVNPVGPCMVSSEGTCAAFYKYGHNKS